MQYTQEYARLNRLAQSWQSMKQKINVGQELAEKTLAYWQTAPIKILVRNECSCSRESLHCSSVFVKHSSVVRALAVFDIRKRCRRPTDVWCVTAGNIRCCCRALDDFPRLTRFCCSTTALYTCRYAFCPGVGTSFVT